MSKLPSSALIVKPHAVIPFEFDGNRIRVHLDENGEPRFVVADVAAVLGYATTGHATRLLRDDEKGIHNVDTLGGPQKLSVTSEAGLYRLVTMSRRPEAEQFKRWVFHEVLPSIRKTGGYGQPLDMRDHRQLATAALQLIEINEEYRKQLVEAQPKVEGYDKLIDADGLKGLQHAGKALGMRPNKFIELLVANGYLFRRRFDKKLLPYQQYVDTGIFEIKNHVANDRAHMQTFVTQKGFDHF